MNEECNFSLTHYKRTLSKAKEKGYNFYSMQQWHKNKDNLPKDLKAIVMRHDIDHNLKLVLNFSKIESDLGIPTTYFIRLHGNYNPYTFEHYTILKKLKDSNHELALHYDCDFARLFGEDSKEFLKRDISIFENMINQKISGLSAHEPNKSQVLVTDELLGEFGLQYQAYSDTFFKDLKYISDSSSRWREGCMCNFIDKDTPKLCILTHPFWWFDRSPLENY